MGEQTKVQSQVKQCDHFIETKENQTEKVSNTKIKSRRVHDGVHCMTCV